MTNDNDIVDAAAVAPPNQQRQYGLDQVNVSFLDTSNADNGDASRRTLPLVVSPRWDASSEFLSHFLVVNRPWMNEQILKYGAVLIRGFDVADPVRFEQAVLSLQPDLCDAYRGTSPRSLMPGTTFSFSAADVPVTYPIAQHLEMSFLKSPPRQLYFGCMKASSKPGGETSLCDFRKVYQDLSPELRSKVSSHPRHCMCHVLSSHFIAFVPSTGRCHKSILIFRQHEHIQPRSRPHSSFKIIRATCAHKNATFLILSSTRRRSSTLGATTSMANPTRTMWAQC
mmetsp:Transcript_27789/g.77862  ORF Transcript_27789/g.77862 Transcript_27789/m.77862 type:complete len:283 (+) Transcript_27789:140-988(+)